MGFLNWIKDRNAARQQSVARKPQEQKPENAKEMYTRHDALERALAKPITPEIKAMADRVLATIEKASGQTQLPSATTTPESGGNPAALLQNQHRQDTSQNALSPTDGTAGKTAVEGKKSAPEKPVQRVPQTLPRRPPSWER